MFTLVIVGKDKRVYKYEDMTIAKAIAKVKTALQFVDIDSINIQDKQIGIPFPEKEVAKK